MTDVVEATSAVDVVAKPRRGRGSTRRAAPKTAAERFGVLPMPSLDYTPEVAAATAHLYERVRQIGRAHV